MNKAIPLFVFVLLSISMMSQYKETDSLHQRLEREENDSSRVNLMFQIASEYFTIKPDSSLWYYRQALDLSKVIKYRKGEITASAAIAELFTRTGNYPEALRASLQNVKICEDLHDIENIFWAKRNLLWIYRDIGDTVKMLQTLNELGLLANSAPADRITKIPFKQIVSHNIASVYSKKGEYDSAFKYERSVYDQSMQINDTDMLAVSASGLAEFHGSTGNIDSEFYYYKKALAYAEIALRFDIARRVKSELASSFAKKEQLDSALFYGYQSYSEYKEVPDTIGTMNTALLLSEFYGQRKQFDSAYKYLSEFTNLKEKTLSEEKIEKAQNINFNESLHQQQLQAERDQAQQQYKSKIKVYGLIGGLVAMLVLALILYRNNKQKQKTNSLLQKQKEEIQDTLQELKSAQVQLIQSEKMASLGELTAGIAHEIQNPLNFVNNFSEVNGELLKELKAEAEKGNLEEVKAIAKDIEFNSEKINHHGKRADAIVKGMLQHSRSSSGQKEPTDINALCDEYLRLAYHGLRAKEKSFNATMKTDFDDSIGKINIIPQDIGRVILNLINNAFYVVDEKKKENQSGYEPEVEVSTKKNNGKIEIKVSDNGNGIPQKVLDKIFQPFFTTKPTGQGTGLGLSLAYDIVTKGHGGELRVETKEGEGTVFVIKLPTTFNN